MRPTTDMNKRDLQHLENYRNDLFRLDLIAEKATIQDIPYLQFEATLLVAKFLMEVRDELRKGAG